MELVVLKDISKNYDDKDVLKNINMAIKQGEFFTFLGPSGCGKTTLLRIIAGFTKPEKGEVFLNDKNITSLPAEKRNIGMVFQNYALFPFMNVFDNIAYGLKIEKISKKDIKKRVEKYLDLVNLNGYENRPVSKLSGGEQQRVALARSLVMEPQILLLDEPLSNLDARLRDKMRYELKEIQSKLGITTVFVTHDQTEALTMSDRIAVFNHGECIQIGTPNDIYLKPNNTFVANFIGETNLFKAKFKSKSAILAPDFSMEISDNTKGSYVSIRPQDIDISRDSKNDTNDYVGDIEGISTSGLLIEYLVKVNDFKFKVTKLNGFTNENPLQLGDKVHINIDPRSIKILEN